MILSEAFERMWSNKEEVFDVTREGTRISWLRPKVEINSLYFFKSPF